MDWLDSVSSSLIGKDLDGLWARQRAISDNLANYETPGYKTKVVSFEDRLREELAQTGLTGSEAAREIADVQPVTSEKADETYRADGNGVDLEQQNVELARTQLNYYYSLRTLADTFSRLKTAIGGGT